MSPEAVVAMLAAVGTIVAAAVSVLTTQVWNARMWVRKQRQSTYLSYVTAYARLRRESGRTRFGRPSVQAQAEFQAASAGLELVASRRCRDLSERVHGLLADLVECQRTGQDTSGARAEVNDGMNDLLEAMKLDLGYRGRFPVFETGHPAPRTPRPQVSAKRPAPSGRAGAR